MEQSIASSNNEILDATQLLRKMSNNFFPYDGSSAAIPALQSSQQQEKYSENSEVLRQRAQQRFIREFDKTVEGANMGNNRDQNYPQ